MLTFDPALVEALGHTLLHSLWQGALLAAGLWYALRLLPEAQAARRHRYALAAALALLPAALLTFWWVYAPTAMPTSIAELPTGALLPVAAADAGNVAAPTLLNRLSGAVPYLGYAWLTGCLLFSLRILGGWWHQHRLRTVGAAPLNAYWQAELRRIAGRLGVRNVVTLSASTQVKSPLLLGWLRPLILLPIGAVNALSPDEVAAVLAHELAHLARHDNWWNAALQLLDVLFYYHPAWWYLHRCVRTEREHACDDLALQAGAAPLVYARALVRLQEISIATPALALGFGSPRRPLLHRVRRILQPSLPEKSTRMEKYILPLLLLIAVIGVGFYPGEAPAGPPPTTANDPAVQMVSTTLCTASANLELLIDHVRFEVDTDRSGNIERVMRAGEVIPVTEQRQYPLEMDIIRKQLADFAAFRASFPEDTNPAPGVGTNVTTIPRRPIDSLASPAFGWIEKLPGEYYPSDDHSVPMPTYQPTIGAFIPNADETEMESDVRKTPLFFRDTTPRPLTREERFMRGLPQPPPTPEKRDRNISILNDNGKKRIRVTENGFYQELRFDEEEIREYRRNGKVIPVREYGLYMDDINELRELHENTPPPPPPPPPAPRAPGIPPPPPPAPAAPPVPDGSSDIRIEQSGGQSQTVIVENNKVYVNGELVSEDAEGRRIVIEDGKVRTEAASNASDAAYANAQLEMQEALLRAREIQAEQRTLAETARQKALQRAMEVRAEADSIRHFQLEAMREQLEQTRQEAFTAGEKARAEADRLRAEHDQSRARLVAELQADGLYQPGQRLRFRLTPTELKINGKVQSDALHRKYLGLSGIDPATANAVYQLQLK